jgi:hypothetical protein
MVIDRHDDGAAGFLHRHAHPGAERQAVAGGGHAILMKDRTAARSAAFVMRAVPCCDPSLGCFNGGR